MTESDTPQPGEAWAYRASVNDQLVEVRVIKVGTSRPRRVQVRFVDDKFEGRQDWVSPARLMIRWESVDDFRAMEARWDRMWELGIGIDDPLWNAADEVFRAYVSDDVASLRYREAGATRIRDTARLTELTELPTDVWSQCRDAFHQGDELVVPWPVTEAIVRAIAERNATELLDAVRKDEEKARRESLYGYISRGRGGKPDHEIGADICREVDEEIGKPCRAAIRLWCGDEAVERYDELAELRREIRRVGHIAELAIDALGRTEEKWRADHLRRELGVTAAGPSRVVN